MTTDALRTLAVWCPRWPITAAGVGPDEPAAVFFANRVVVASQAAEAWGVHPGLRRREAQARCPEMTVLEDDPGRDARAFDPVVETVEAFTPRIEVVRPGLCAFMARGPSRYFGGEEALAAEIAEAVGHGCRTGIADGPFAASLAARDGRIVAPGDTRAFLAGFGVDVLEPPPLVDVLRRLGIRTLGDLAALPAPTVGARFGADGIVAHRLARGEEGRPLALRTPLPELAVRRELDEPVASVDAATFVAKAAADELVAHLTELGLACARLRIEAETEHGERSERTWRYSAAFTPQAIAERVRWQLEGWLGAADPPTAPISILVLAPQDVGPAHGSQVGFWGRVDDPTDAVRRAMHRVQGLLGHTGALTATLSGGRDLREQATLVPWGDPVEPARPGLPGDATVAGPVTVETPPWPGRLPAPSPALVHLEPATVEVTDADGRTVGVTGRFSATSPPDTVRWRGRCRRVMEWTGPWPAEERWWDPSAHRRRARIQVALDDGTAHLLVLEEGLWRVEATYD